MGDPYTARPDPTHPPRWIVVGPDGREVDALARETNQTEAERFAAQLNEAATNGAAHASLRAALLDAAAQFTFYARQHMEKTPPDRVKASTNIEWSERCLTAASIAPPVSQESPPTAAHVLATKEDWIAARPPAEAPFGQPVLAWLFLPKNPQASSWVIAHRANAEGYPESHDELGDFEPGCWWANGRYYAPGHVKAWLWLPLPWSSVSKESPPTAPTPTAEHWLSRLEAVVTHDDLAAFYRDLWPHADAFAHALAVRHGLAVRTERGGVVPTERGMKILQPSTGEEA